MELLFWISLFVIFYTYIGYGIVLYVLVRFKRARIDSGQDNSSIQPIDFPSCTVIVAAYNEEFVIEQKIINTLALRYPKDKLHYYFVTDGSTDGTPVIVQKYPKVTLLHSPERKGKIAAVHRAMNQITTEVVVFTDANTLLNDGALLELCKHYTDKQIGGVAGEKRVYSGDAADASAAGEGFYWKYESTLKKWDSELYSVVGSAGELFSIRTALYEAVELDTVLDDFMISMRIAEKGYKVAYEPNACATELASENVKEELKRKIRIAAGGIQSIVRLRKMLNPLNNPILNFQYVSHRVLRWTVTPVLLVVLFVMSAVLHFADIGWIYTLMFYGQVLFYVLAFVGFLLERKELKAKITFIPYYFCIMNYAVLAGIRRYLKGQQSAVWEKVGRKG